MTNSVTTYWDVDGVSLQTYAWDINSLGSRIAAIPLRGDNVKIPYAAGEVWVPKVPDSRTITLDMWVLGGDRNGAILDEDTFQQNWESLRALLWQPDRQLALTKRWYTWVPGVAPEDPPVKTMLTATGYAEFKQGLNPAVFSKRAAKFTVDLFMADPFFYGPVVELDRITMASPDLTFDVPGDWATPAIDVQYTGPLAAPRLTVTSRTPNVWMNYAGAILDSETADIDCNSYRAVYHSGGGDVKTSGHVTHSGSNRWLEFRPGETTLHLSAQTGTGFADVSYQPVWF